MVLQATESESQGVFRLLFLMYLSLLIVCWVFLFVCFLLVLLLVSVLVALAGVRRYFPPIGIAQVVEHL